MKKQIFIFSVILKQYIYNIIFRKYIQKLLFQTNTHNKFIKAGTMPIQRMYEVGALYVEKKVKKALDLYNEMLPTFVE